MRGTPNNQRISAYLKHFLFVEAVYEFFMLRMIPKPHLAFPRDDIALLKAECEGNVLPDNEGNRTCDDGAVWLASLEIRNKVTTRTFGPSFCN